jgi:hypothetical protein
MLSYSSVAGFQCVKKGSAAADKGELGAGNSKTLRWGNDKTHRLIPHALTAYKSIYHRIARGRSGLSPDINPSLISFMAVRP